MIDLNFSWFVDINLCVCVCVRARTRTYVCVCVKKGKVFFLKRSVTCGSVSCADTDPVITTTIRYVNLRLCTASL